VSGGAAGPAPAALLAAFIAYVALERILELALSARHARRLIAAGAVEHGRSHFPLFVVLHALWPLALVLEVVAGPARPGPWWWAWLALFAAAQALRFASMAALGQRWTTRVLVPPGAPLSRRGPYRWLRHPNYLAVIAELIAAPLVFGAWRTALGATLVNLVALSIRVRVEERALGLTPPAVRAEPGKTA
jgi:methyltransferase